VTSLPLTPCSNEEIHSNYELQNVKNMERCGRWIFMAVHRRLCRGRTWETRVRMAAVGIDTGSQKFASSWQEVLTTRNVRFITNCNKYHKIQGVSFIVS